MEARRLSGDHPDAMALVAAMVGGLQALYGSQPGDADVSEFVPPSGGFVALYEDERPVAGGAVRRLETDVAEIKRMYVVPEARSRGLARRLLAELEDLARDLGYARVRLDTGWEQPHARALYSSAGYSEIDDYNGNPLAAYWGEKRL